MKVAELAGGSHASLRLPDHRQRRPQSRKGFTLILILVFVISLVWAVITRPTELIGFLLIALLTEALSLRPLITIFCIAVVVVIVTTRKPVIEAA